MPRTNLTQSFVDSDECCCPKGRNSYEYNDTQVIGLYCAATPSGCKTFRFAYKDAQNKRRHIKIGLASDISLKAARGEAQKMRGRILAGEDPSDERQQRNAMPTWDEFFEQDYLPHAQAKKRTWKNDLDMHRIRISPKFGNMKLDRITAQQIENFHISVREEGLAPATADHYLKLMKRVFTIAQNYSMLATNPARNVALFRVPNEVERYLSDEELRRLMRVLRTYDNRPMACLVLWLLATGARTGEALHAGVWRNIDRNRRIWTVPHTQSKNKRRRIIHLNDVAVSVLDELETRRDSKTDHLFVGRRGPLKHIGKNWKRLCKAADISGLTPHGLRHSYASMLANAGHSILEISNALGHQQVATSSRYTHLSPSRKREAADSAATRIQAAME